MKQFIHHFYFITLYSYTRLTYSKAASYGLAITSAMLAFLQVGSHQILSIEIDPWNG
jgi:hypothetical protein